MKEKEILFLINDEILTYKENGNFDVTYDEYIKIKKLILSDLNYDIKLIEIPNVKEEVRKNIIINSVKKYSLITINENNIDYKALYEDNDKLKVIVFIKKDTDINNDNKKLYTTYHILENLIIRGSYPIQTSFIINYGKVIFLYEFNNGYFVKRNIIPDNELNSLRERNADIYCININSDDQFVQVFKSIPKEEIKDSIFSIRKSLFNKIKDFEFKKNLIIASLLFLFFIFLFEFYIVNKNKENDKYLKKLKTKESILREEKSKRGISDKLFNEYSFIMKNKSKSNEFFYLLYQIGKDNIEIDGISFSDNKFSLNGLCSDDSKLEGNFRKSQYFKNISFSFTKKDNRILFRIDGEFLNE